jgi:C-terminal processing protease CtpA/Prc
MENGGPNTYHLLTCDFLSRFSVWLSTQGKLGIVIDTTLEGPIVHKISADSPLDGIVFPGDIIVAINDVDTRAMSASAITALMARTSTARRVLTVLSEDVSN